MSLMTQSLLMEAQSLRLEGDIDGSIALLRIVISNCNADAGQSAAADDTEHLMTHQLREMASYQLALLLLQTGGRCSNQRSEREADEILMKLGYRSRLSTKAFGYPACECVVDKSSCELKANNESKLPLIMIDNILPQQFFDALRQSFRPNSQYWTNFYIKTNEGEGGTRRIFASHNVPLPIITENNYAKCIEEASSLLEQVAIIVKHCLSQRFPSILTATSAEVWSHRRPPDAQHQLHYDMDEIRLHKLKQRHKDECNSTTRGNKRQKVENCSEDSYNSSNAEDFNLTKDICPILSCVLTISVPNESKACDKCGRLGDGAPTLVCNQSLLGSRSNEGWLCYPRLNRLVAFDGSLLHAVVPGIPSEALSEDEDDCSRVTLMMGFWKEVTLTVPDKTSLTSRLTIGPNVPFPSSLLEEFKPISSSENTFTMHGHAVTNHVIDPNLVRPLWTEIDQAGDSNEEVATASEKDFSGRFFLRSIDPTDIDKEVLDL